MRILHSITAIHVTLINACTHVHTAVKERKMNLVYIWRYIKILHSIGTVINLKKCIIFKGFTVQSSYKLKLPPHLIVQAANIKITETIGQGKLNFCTKYNTKWIFCLGEFGVVYKGHLLRDGGNIVTATVAIKTLKGWLLIH